MSRHAPWLCPVARPGLGNTVDVRGDGCRGRLQSQTDKGRGKPKLDYQVSRLWGRTLAAPTPVDEAEEYRSKLRFAYQQFREQVQPLANDIALSVPDYTDHGISHADALWDTASMLIGDDFPINPAEAFVLGGAFLIHDLGMGIQAYSRGLLEIVSTVEWLDLLATLHPHGYVELQQQLVAQLDVNPTWNGIESPSIKHALTIFLRIRHAEQAERVLSQEWSLSSGQSFYLIADTSLRFRYAELIGKVARSHWLNVDEIPAIFPSTLGAPAGYPTEWTIDPIKISCLLRLADASQIDSRRADPLHTPHRLPQGSSMDHWIFQERMLTPQRIDGRLVYTSAAALEYKDADAWWLSYDTAKMVDNELRKVDALCADLSRPRFTVSAVAGVESAERFAQFVPTSGWRPLDARPRITNSAHVISTLGGSQLYGASLNERETPIRELIANALDATRARRAAIGEDGIRPIQVKFTATDDEHHLTVRDFGIGMTAADLIENLCDFGRSGWRDYEMARKFPGIHATGFEPTGKFGIGFFSVFMIADQVTISTRSIRQSWDDTSVLEFHGGPGKRPLLRQATQVEKLAEPGTLIKLILRRKMGSKGGLFETASYMQLSDNLRIASMIRNLALMSDESIDSCALDNEKFESAIRRNEWQTMTNAEVFDALNYGLKDFVPPDAYSHMAEQFANLSSIYTHDGRELGRMALLLPEEDDDWGYYSETFHTYCGGLRSANDAQYGGIVQGQPTRAQRDRVKTDLRLADMQAWFKAQLQTIPDVKLQSPGAQLTIQRAGIGIGIRTPELAIAYTVDGYLNPAELANYIRSRSVVYMVDSYATRLALGDEVHMGFQTRDDRLCLVQDGQISANSFIGRFYSEADSPFPVRQDEFKDRWLGRPNMPNAFDPVPWWRRSFATPAGEVIRIVAESWEADIGELVESMSACEVRDGQDSRLELPCLGGGLGKVEALMVRRPNG